MKSCFARFTALVLLGCLADTGPGRALAPAGSVRPPAAVSTPLIHMIDSGALKDIADHVEFQTWKDPDQLRVLVLGGKADFVAMPSNVAANLYNRGVGLRLLNISTWGVLWMVSRDKTAKTLSDFKGQGNRHAFPGRHAGHRF